MRRLYVILVCCLLIGLAAWPARAAEHVLRLATTTSTVNSGLMAVLRSAFEADTKITLSVIAVGSGKALKLGRDGQVDAILVHAREAEQRFVDAGHGLARHEVMHNDFVIVGPGGDPAGIRGAADALAALRRIGEREASFISRGDDSGTHKKEMRLWKELGVEPYGLWYREVGLGMSDTLAKAAELGGYTLTDRGTWLFMRDRLALKLLVADPAHLANHYGVIAVNPKRHPGANARDAKVFIDWLLSPRAQGLIQNYRVQREQLFTPRFPGKAG